MHIGRYEPYQAAQEFPFPRENIQKLSFEKWNKTEQEVCIEMIRHYDNDFNSISFQMTKTLGGKIFRPGLIRRVYYSLMPEQELTNQDVQKIIKVYSFYLLNKKRHIWPNIQQKFISYWHVDELKQKFINFIKEILRCYIYLFGNTENRHFFEGRVTRIGLLQYNAIFYFGQYNPNSLEQESQLIVDICDACKKLLYLISYYIENDLQEFNDPYELNMNQLDKLPSITKEEFEQIMERIIVLDTIHRICYGLYPYFSLTEEIQYNPQIELEYFPVAPRQHVKIGSKYLSKNKNNKYTNSKYTNDNQNQAGKRFYPILSTEQANYIIQSQTVQLMLTHISFLQRDAKLLY